MCLVKLKVPGRLLLYAFLFFRFCFVLFAYLFCCFSINICLNSYYLIECNKQQEKYRVSKEKIVKLQKA